jgi:hypothetical protein
MEKLTKFEKFQVKLATWSIIAGMVLITIILVPVEKIQNKKIQLLSYFLQWGFLIILIYIVYIVFSNIFLFK